jgi:methylated-DNA-[protein]-cysteine S-methyltransferase
MKRKCSIQTPLGEMVAVAEEDALCGLWFVDTRHATEDTGDAVEDPDYPLFTALRGQLDTYFAGKLRVFDLPVTLQGTPFQLAVWALLPNIPAGTTTTYGALARQLAECRGGRIPAAQAVGGAVGRNPVSIIVPCHRVVGADGSLVGYGGGLDRKSALLALEKGRNSLDSDCIRKVSERGNPEAAGRTTPDTHRSQETGGGCSRDRVDGLLSGLEKED